MDPKEQIKSKLDIVPFIQEHIPLKQAGRNFKAICPFHGEKTPSFVVSPERQIWHCFGCGKGGDIFTFLMEFEKLDFVEALRELAKRTGVKLVSLSPSKGQQQKEKLLQINHLASEFYHYLLTKHTAGERALAYLAKRGISKKTIETFSLGFAPNRWDLLLGFLTKKKGYDLKDVEDAGLIIRSQQSAISNQRFYDRFRNRIIFTLRDHRGNVVGFAGRVLEDDVKDAKYVNTPETLLYHKGELFFGLDVTKEAIKKENQAIIVEGEFDMLSSFQAGVANAVALKGTALTLMQAKLIRRFTQNIALAFDIDVAGDAAARRGIDVADTQGLNIKVIRLKDAKDPDEAMRKHGVAGWKSAIKKAESVYDFLIDSALARFDASSPDGKKAISEEVLPSLATITNEIVKSHFVKKISDKLDVSEDVVLRQMEKIQKPKVGLRDETVAKSAQLSRQDILEEYVLALLLQRAEAAFVKTMTSTQDLLQNPAFRKIFNHLLAYYEKEASFTIGTFVKGLPKELIATVDRLYLFDTQLVKPENVASEIEKAIRELRVIFLRKQMAHITDVLREGEKAGNHKAVFALKQQFTLISTQLHKLTVEEGRAN